MLQALGTTTYLFIEENVCVDVLVLSQEDYGLLAPVEIARAYRDRWHPKAAFAKLIDGALTFPERTEPCGTTTLSTNQPGRRSRTRS